ncbi:NB-ARC domain-containing protein [Nocardia rhamnosiphila]|uniref:NB-ARC domain-containing protein n=1 Tax=Nocardia rhamnosiphila TaxID=426716 RepID=A0ABV2WXU4_9NOCA
MDRKDEVEQVLRHLEDGEFVVTVEGEIGVGKSALAMEAAHRLASASKRTPALARFELLIWMDAANDCPDLEDLARNLSLMTGDQSMSGAPTAGKAAAIRAYLAAHPSVLVIDNLRMRRGDRNELHDFLRMMPSGCRAIVSANTIGVVDGPRVHLHELPAPYAHDLVTQEARKRGLDALIEADEVLAAQIHRIAGGNPRAIRLLVLAASTFPGPLSEMLDELESGSEEMAIGLHDAVWEELSADARRTLGVCAYLPHGASTGQIAAALGSPESAVRITLVRLWEVGLLSSSRPLERTAYTCSAALRNFVTRRLGNDYLAEVRTALATALVERFTTDWEDAAGAAPHIQAVRTLIPDLNAAGQHRLCIELFCAIYDILFTLGLFDDRIALGWIAFQSAAALDEPEHQSLALSVVSSTHAIRGEDTLAEAAVRRGLTIARSANSDRETARQLRCEGFRLFRSGKAAEALAVVTAEDAEDMARRSGDINNMIDIQSLVGAAHWHLRDLDQCEETVVRFLAECDALPWERGKAYALRDLAEVRLMRRDFEEAANMVAKARAVATEYRDVRQLARIRLTEARLQLFTGLFRQAQDTARVAAQESAALLLAGEHAESRAVARIARLCVRRPWRRLKVAGSPRFRFTEMTVGGD